MSGIQNGDSMKNRNFIYLALAVILIISCNFPAFLAPDINPVETAPPALEPAGVAPTATTSGLSLVPFGQPSNGPLNCRSGPGTFYPVLMILNPGQSTEITGRNADSSWLYVKNLNLPGGFCWIISSFTVVTGDISSLVVVAAPPPPPTSNVPTTEPAGSAGVVTSVDISIKPDTIHVGGCIGPIQPVTLYAKITTNGPVTITWHFKDEQIGNLSDHNLKFKKPDTQDVSDSYTPPVNGGKFRVEILIDGMNLKGMNGVTFYTITC